MSGPPPKRSEERRRRNKEDHGLIDRAQAFESTAPEPPDPNPDWHPIARDMYLSLQNSGQAQFYEASDWMVAQYVMEMLSASLEYELRPSAHMFVGVMQALGDLMATEGSRRRLRLELTRDKDEKPSAGVTALAEYRKKLGG